MTFAIPNHDSQSIMSFQTLTLTLDPKKRIRIYRNNIFGKSYDLIFYDVPHNSKACKNNMLLNCMVYGTPGQTKMRLFKRLFKHLFLRIKYDFKRLFLNLNIYFFYLNVYK